ncbi:MAG: GemA protein [Methylomonas sp.]|nr:MAG: GemA protein [Methylomonas sp.]
MQQSSKFDRKKHLQLLAIGKQQLGWDDEFYRGIWLPLRGARPDADRRYSAATLDDGQLRAALEEMRRQGFKPAAKSAGSRKLADDAQSKKIRALWLQLHKTGKVRDPSEAALARWIAGQFKTSSGIEALQWISREQASRIIEQLKKWLDR